MVATSTQENKAQTSDISASMMQERNGKCPSDTIIIKTFGIRPSQCWDFEMGQEIFIVLSGDPLDHTSDVPNAVADEGAAFYPFLF